VRPQTETRYLFIDGAYLREALRTISSRNGTPIPLNPNALTGGFRKSFFYDCPPVRRENETQESFDTRVAEANAIFEGLRAAPGAHVIEGTTTGVRQRQKQVDVAIAVDMLSHSHRGNMTQATLLSGDLDFKPVVDALVRDGMWVSIWCEPSSASKDLWLSADERRDFDVHTILQIAAPRFRERYPEPDQFGQVRQTTLTGALRRGYSATFNLDAYLIQTPQRWEVVMQSRTPSDHELRFGHADRDFLEAYVRYTRDVAWE
jgi:uncharacterized LabA/DUF88 family protein